MITRLIDDNASAEKSRGAFRGINGAHRQLFSLERKCSFILKNACSSPDRRLLFYSLLRIVIVPMNMFSIDIRNNPVRCGLRPPFGVCGMVIIHVNMYPIDIRNDPLLGTMLSKVQAAVRCM